MSLYGPKPPPYRCPTCDWVAPVDHLGPEWGLAVKLASFGGYRAALHCASCANSLLAPILKAEEDRRSARFSALAAEWEAVAKANKALRAAEEAWNATNGPPDYYPIVSAIAKADTDRQNRIRAELREKLESLGPDE